MTALVETGRRTIKPPTLHLCLPGDLAEKVRVLARARGDHPQALAAHLIDRTIDTGHAAQLLANADPESAPGHGRRRVGELDATLTQLQCAVLYLVGCNRNATGICTMAATKIGHLLGRGSENHVTEVLRRLRALGLIAPAGGRVFMVQPWTLTDEGVAVWRELAEGGV